MLVVLPHPLVAEQCHSMLVLSRALNCVRLTCAIFYFVLRFALSGMDMEQRDYDSRTALHVAAAEGTVSSHSICCLSVCLL